MLYLRDDYANLSHETLYSPPRPNLVRRPRLIERLNEGLHGKLTLIAAPAGFGKTTLDAGDNDPTRFLTYLVAALQTLALSRVPPGREGIAPQIGAGVLGVLQSPLPPRSPPGAKRC